MNKNKILPLESLRGIAAVSVVFFHLNIGSNFNNGFTNNAWLMVDFFFVLSGFVIHLNYKNKISNLRDLLRFQKKRFIRLYPLHLMMLIVFTLIEFLKYAFELKYGVEANTPAFQISNFYSFVANVFLLHNWIIPDLSFNVVSWSISAEFYTYAIFGIFMIFPRFAKKYLIASCCFLIITTGMILYINSFGTDTISGPTRCLYSFILGMLVHHLQEVFKVKIRYSLLSIISLATLVTIVILFGSKNTNPGLVIAPWIFALSIFIIVSTSQDALIIRMLSKRYLVFLGTISYSIYMTHTLFTWSTYQLLRFVFNAPTHFHNGITTVHLDNVYLADLVVIFVLMIVIYFSVLTYRHVEIKAKLFLEKKLLV